MFHAKSSAMNYSCVYIAMLTCGEIYIAKWSCLAYMTLISKQCIKYEVSTVSVKNHRQLKGHRFCYWISHPCSWLCPIDKGVQHLCSWIHQFWSRICHICTSIRHLGNGTRCFCNGNKCICTRISRVCTRINFVKA